MKNPVKHILAAAAALVIAVALQPAFQAQATHVVDLDTVNAPLLNEQGVIENNGSLTCPACGAKNVTWVDLSEVGKSTMDPGSYHCYVDGETAESVAAKIGLTTGNYTLCLHTNNPDVRIKTQLVVRKGNTLNVLGNGEIQKSTGQTILNNVGGATVNLYGGEIIGGGWITDTASSWVAVKGAAISMHSEATSTVTKSKLLITGTAMIRNGCTTDVGGLIYTDGVDITLAGNARLKSGHAASGGGMYVRNGGLTITGGRITECESAEKGGSIYLDGSLFEMTGGRVQYGVAASEGAGGNLYAAGSEILLRGGEFVNGGLIVGPGSVLRLAETGATDATAPIGLTDEASLQILADWAGAACLDCGDQSGVTWGTTLSKVQAGTYLAGVFTPGDVEYTGWLTCANLSGSPHIVLTDGDDPAGTVAVGSIQFRNLSDGTLATWATGLSGYDITQYYVRYSNQTGGTITLTGDLIMDVNGKTRLPTFTSEKEVTLSLLDTSNDDYDGCGAVRYSGNVTLNPDVSAKGCRYITLDNGDGTVSAHRVGIQLENVVLRTQGEIGYYYQVRYGFDRTVEEKIAAYGIAVSLEDMPGADFAQETESINKWTYMDNADSPLESGALVNGGLLKNILVAGGEANHDNLLAGVYANPYLKLNIDGDSFVMVGDAENANTQGGICLSMLDAIRLIDGNFKAMGSGTKALMHSFYDCWEEVLRPYATQIAYVSRSIETRTVSSLNVMSFNVLGYKADQANHPVEEVPAGMELTADMRMTSRFPKLLALLEGEAVDIVGLQEVTEVWRKEIAQNLPDKYSAIIHGAYEEKNYDTGVDAGVGILYNNTKYELLESGRYYLAPENTDKPTLAWDAAVVRLVAWGVFREKESGAIFLFKATHLDADGAQARAESAKLILAKLDEMAPAIEAKYGIRDLPVVVVGDFNNTARTESIKTMLTVLGDAKLTAEESGDAQLATYNELYYCADESAFKTRYIIDYIFHSPETTQAATYKVIPTNTNLCPYGAFISDHCAIVSNMQLYNDVVVEK